MAGPPSPPHYPRRPAPPSWLATATAGVLGFWVAYAAGSAALNAGVARSSAGASAAGGPASRLVLAGRAHTGMRPICGRVAARRRRLHAP